MGQNSGSLTTTGSVSLGANKAVTDTLVGIQLQGTYGTVTGVIEGLFPVQPGASPVWAPLAAQDASTGAVVSGTISPSDNTTRIFYANGAGLSDVRWRATNVGSGTLYVALSSGSYLGLPSFLTQNNSTLGATTVSTLHATGAVTFDSTLALTGLATLAVEPIGPVATVAAAGSAIGNAAAVTTGFTLVTGADNTTGVVLPASVAGKKVTLKSSASGKVLKVYPPVSSKINGATANAVYNMANLSIRTFTCYNSTDWFTAEETPT